MSRKRLTEFARVTAASNMLRKNQPLWSEVVQPTSVVAADEVAIGNLVEQLAGSILGVLLGPTLLLRHNMSPRRCLDGFQRFPRCTRIKATVCFERSSTAWLQHRCNARVALLTCYC